MRQADTPVDRQCLLIEGLERLHFKLRVEAALAQDTELNRRLANLAIEAEDTLAGLTEEFDAPFDGFTSTVN